MGGADAVIKRAREDFKNGEYRFVAEVANKLVFADASNQEARDLAADAYEQLGYLAESATWRNAYLYAAFELRHGAAKAGRGPALNPGTVKSIPTEILFDVLGVQLNGPKADGRHIVINWNFTDAQTSFVLNLEHSALTYVANKQAAARLGRGGSISLTFTAVGHRRKPPIVSHHAHEMKFDDGQSWDLNPIK